eukprot:3768934-Rhodomonas_salina.1
MVRESSSIVTLYCHHPSSSSESSSIVTLYCHPSSESSSIVTEDIHTRQLSIGAGTARRRRHHSRFSVVARHQALPTDAYPD